MATRFDRLTRQKEFDLLKRRGSTGNARFITVRAGGAGPRPRLAIIVSSRISKKAVDRNLIRRRIRSTLQEMPAAALRPTAILVIVRPGSVGLTHQVLKENLLLALRRARVLIEPTQ